jgi:hypothetical protein
MNKGKGPGSFFNFILASIIVTANQLDCNTNLGNL